MIIIIKLLIQLLNLSIHVKFMLHKMTQSNNLFIKHIIQMYFDQMIILDPNTMTSFYGACDIIV